MRWSLLSILLAATVGACGQSLSDKKTGSGGTGDGTGGIATTGTAATGGETNPGTGGAGGSVVALCNALTSEYQSARIAAEGCQVGASGQCQQTVTADLSGCACQVYVTDDSVLATIAQTWLTTGCETALPVAPCDLLCPAALNSTCLATDGGSAGFCSYVAGTGGTGGGATGGTGGSTGDGGLSVCDSLASDYAAVLTGAKSCTAGIAGQCAQSVPSALSFCGTCAVYVNDSSILDALRQKWDAAGCGNQLVPCPTTISCGEPLSPACIPSDAGGSFCSPTQILN